MTTRDRIAAVRAHDPAQILLAAERRTRPSSPFGDHGRVVVVAVERSHGRTMDRGELLDRVCVALERPGVTGVAAAADVLEDLLLLGALEGMTVFGSMGGRPDGGCCRGADTGYDARGIAVMGFEGGSLTLSWAPDDPPSAVTAHAVNMLAAHRLIALVAPAVTGGVPPSGTTAGAVDAVSGLGRTSAYTWLRLPSCPDVIPALRASTLPVLLDIGDDDHTPAQAALRHASVVGVVVGRSVLDPSDGDVATAVDRTVRML